MNGITKSFIKRTKRRR